MPPAGRASTRRRSQPTRVALAGAHGHGRWHLANLRRLADRGIGELVGVCDPRPPTPEMDHLIGDAMWDTDLDAVLARVAPDVTIVCTPIHTHADLALRAAEAGSHVLLEKPAVPSLVEFDRLAAGLARLGAVCQVGFQNLGSGAVAGILGLLADGTIGELRGIGAAGVAVRDSTYFARAAWAGRRRLDGADVVDGALTNPFAHAVAAGIRLAGAESPGAVAATELELHRAFSIESDDTSVARVVTTSGITIVVAATLCAAQPAEPVLIVHGTRGRATWWYTRDDVRVDVDGSSRELRFGRADLLENLIGHLADPAHELIVPLAATRAVSEFVDAVRRAPEPSPIAARHRRAEHSHGSHRWIVDGAASAVERSADTLSMFSEQSVSWAAAAGGGATSVDLAVTGRVVATYELAPRLEPVLAPRPFLHPVRSLGGAVTSDCQPPDHPWHLGVGVAIQDVGGVNCWGGRTYDRHHGYQWRDDHGAVRHVEWVQRSAGLIGHTLVWMGPDHQCRLVEERTITAQPVGGATDRWVLGFRFALRNVSGHPLALGSPGSNGRVGGGYGGFFWRLAPAAGRCEVSNDRAVGEHAVHGRVAPWVAWTQHGREPAGPRDGAFTLMIAAADGQTAADPWFVRMADYPGIGSALAWDEPVVVAPGEIAARSVRALVVDGTGHDLGDLYEQLARATTSTTGGREDPR